MAPCDADGAQLRCRPKSDRADSTLPSRRAQTPQMTREIIQARCERGAQIAVALGFPQATSEAIGHVDEHWCGLGHPVGLAGDEIPLLSRVLLISQTLDLDGAGTARLAADDRGTQ